jgi:hypothetical protein
MPLDSPPEQAQLRGDGLYNIVTGIGDELRDKSRWTTMQRVELGQSEVESLYQCEAIAARIVDLPADDLTREGFTIDGAPGLDVKAVMSAIEEIGRDCEGRPTSIMRCLSDLHRWGDKYGGALLIAAVDDGLPPIEPLDLNRIDRVRGFVVVDRWDVSPISVGNGPPEAYQLSFSDGRLQEQIVHASRVQKFTGFPLPYRRMRQRGWWGVSQYSRLWPRLRQYMTVHGYSETLLHNFTIRVFKIIGLLAARSGQDEDLLRTRLRALDLGADILHGLFLDAGNEKRPGEEFIQQTMSIAGWSDLLDRFVNALVAATPIPRSRLLGETAGGLNSGSNSGETRSYYDWIGAKQDQLATPWLNWCLEILFAAKQGPTRGQRPPEWTIQWNPLWQPSEEEQARVRTANAQADQAYWTIGAVSADEIRKTRHELGSVGHIEAETEDPDLGELAAEPDGDGVVAEESAPGTEIKSVQSAALNGAQITSFLELATAVAEGRIPKLTAVRFLPIAFPESIPDESAAAKLLEPIVEGSDKPAPAPEPDVTPPQSNAGR